MWQSSPGAALTWVAESHMGFADRYAMGNDIRASDAGRKATRGGGAGGQAGRDKADLWRSPLDDVPKPEKVNREMTGVCV